ncbi:CdiA family toxin C-terminal domain-containing protein [Enterococcus sp. LJL128]
MNAFYGELRAQGFDVDECIITKTPHPNFEGIYQIEYQVPKEYKGQLISGEYKKIAQPKTVYDPNIISDDQIYLWGIEAMKNGEIYGNSIYGVAENGLSYTGFLDENRVVKNFFQSFDTAK